jgi:hypothetical protein
MTNAMVRRVERLERQRPEGVLWVILRRFGRPASDPAPRWTPEGRVIVVHEGYEHLGEEMLTSLGVPWEPSNEVCARQQSVDEGGKAFGVEVGA